MKLPEGTVKPSYEYIMVVPEGSPAVTTLPGGVFCLFVFCHFLGKSKTKLQGEQKEPFESITESSGFPWPVRPTQEPPDGSFPADC